jgi:hypothetical protein
LLFFRQDFFSEKMDRMSEDLPEVLEVEAPRGSDEDGRHSSSGSNTSGRERKHRRREFALLNAHGGTGGDAVTPWLERRGDVAKASTEWNFDSSSFLSPEGVRNRSSSRRKVSSLTNDSLETPNSENPKEPFSSFSAAAPTGVKVPTPVRPDPQLASKWKMRSCFSGTRLIDIVNLQNFLEKSTCCRWCANAIILGTLEDFADFIDQRMEEKCSAKDLLSRFKLSRNGAGHSVVVDLPSHAIKREST